MDSRDFEWSPRVPISPLGQVLEKRRVPQWGGPLPVPFSQIPGEAFNEVGLKDLEKRGFGEHKEIFNHLEKDFMVFFNKDSD